MQIYFLFIQIVTNENREIELSAVHYFAFYVENQQIKAIVFYASAVIGLSTLKLSPVLHENWA